MKSEKTNKTHKVLIKINKKSREGKDKFSNLYKLMTGEDFAYQIIAKLKENKGIDKKGFHGFGVENIKELIEKLKKGTYEFSPGVYVHKPGKKKKLGTLSDKIVQGMVNEILIAIYDPKFEKESKNVNSCLSPLRGYEQRLWEATSKGYGFRRNKGVRDVVERIEQTGKNTRWCLEGDIKEAYHKVNHGILLNLISKRIQDKKMIQLIKNMLKSGIMNKKKKIDTNTPQDGIVSLTLFNIYMDAFDQYVLQEIKNEEIKEKVELRSNRNREYDHVTNAINRKVRGIKKIEKKEEVDRSKWNQKDIELEIKHRSEVLGDKRSKMRSRDVRGTRTTYFRYADDWLLMTNGKREGIRNWKEKIRNFLWKELKLQDEKTKETDLRKEPAKFLGFSLCYSKSQKQLKDNYGRRTTGQQLTVRIDMEKALDKLTEKGFYNKEKKQGVAKNGWTVLSDYEIVENFNWLKRGVVGYFAQGVRKFYIMNHLRWILETACKKTIGKKHNLSTIKVMKKYGRYIEVSTKRALPWSLPSGGENQKAKTIREMSYDEEKALFEKIRKNRKIRIEEHNFVGNWRTAMKLKSKCTICGSENLVAPSIKNIKAKGFEKIM
jgi:hypothetical protein